MPLIPVQTVSIVFRGQASLLAVDIALNTDYIASIEPVDRVPLAMQKFGPLVDVTMAHPRDKVYRCLGKPEDFLVKEVV